MHQRWFVTWAVEATKISYECSPIEQGPYVSLLFVIVGTLLYAGRVSGTARDSGGRVRSRLKSDATNIW